MKRKIKKNYKRLSRFDRSIIFGLIIDAIKKIKETSPIEKDLYSKFSLSNRSRKLIEFARLEGLEPPTL